MWGPFVGGHHSPHPTHPWYSRCWDKPLPLSNKPASESVPGKVSVPWPSAASHKLTLLCLASPCVCLWASSSCGLAQSRSGRWSEHCPGKRVDVGAAVSQEARCSHPGLAPDRTSEALERGFLVLQPINRDKNNLSILGFCED